MQKDINKNLEEKKGRKKWALLGLLLLLLGGGTTATTIAVVNRNKKIDGKKIDGKQVINEVWNEKFFNKLLRPMYYGNVIKQLNKELKQKGVEEVSFDFPSLLDTTIGNANNFNVKYKNETINLQFGEFMPLSKEPTYNEGKTICTDMGWKFFVLTDDKKRHYIISPQTMEKTVKEVPTQLPWFINGLDEVFKGNENKEIKGIENWDTSDFEVLRFVFWDAKKFDQDLASWNTSNVKGLVSTFFNAESFNQDISSWNTSNVTNMSGAFSGAKSFNQDLSKWDTSKVTQMIGTFKYAESFNGNITTWDLSSVNEIDGMFENAKKFNQDISTREIEVDGKKYKAWDTSNIRSMNEVFLNATSFDQNISNWNVDKVNKSYKITARDEDGRITASEPTFSDFETGSKLTADKMPNFIEPK
ncbi:BspA family leucine-rich repeat surface protein [Mycoplasma yeatsii]|uniref:Surface protein n=1 Tax=Mycoplasma yeatsii TaxID=51365 RepID=A0ABU0NF57_9MOLU|nr:BspA family leucine-rich repeat surface protein [Mycoplasma yeatsii]MDQ0568074.1 surface protein [Mycoplasma yeatsii]